MKKRFVTSLVAAALLGLAGTGTAQAAEAPAGTPAQGTATTAPTAGSALPDLSSLPTLVLGQAVSAIRVIHDWA